MFHQRVQVFRVSLNAGPLWTERFQPGHFSLPHNDTGAGISASHEWLGVASQAAEEESAEKSAKTLKRALRNPGSSGGMLM